MTSEKKNIRTNVKTTRRDWICEARKILAEEGVGGIKIDRLARNLAVTRGGFYWFFKNRQHLLDVMLGQWQDSRNDTLTGKLREVKISPLVSLARFIVTPILERSHSSALDPAVRDWARVSVAARHAVDLVDNRRILLLAKKFHALNYDREEAFIRARILYFHQVGYHAMAVHETEAQRLHYLPIYFRQFTGFDLPGNALDGFR